MVQVQVRMSEHLVEEIDRWIAEGRFKSRSEAVRTMVAFYQERERTRDFYRMLVERSQEATDNPHLLVPLEDIP